MAINLIISTDSLTPPVTGIGYYTAHLLDEFLKSPEFNQVKGINHSGLQNEDELRLLLHEITAGELGAQSQNSETTSTEVQAKPAFKPGWKERLKEFLKKIPGAYAVARHWYAYRHKRAVRKELAKDKSVRWLVHGPNYIQPDHGGDSVITIHDLSHLRHPETHPRERVDWLNRHLPKAMSDAAKIICVSEFTRREMINLELIENSDKAVVCLNGIGTGFKPYPYATIKPELDKWGLGYRGYILSAATLEPRKNLERLLDAYEALPEELARQFPLVLVGSAGWKNQTLRQRIARIKPPRHVITTGYLDRKALQDLTCGARLFAYISIYEGFGLPVIEAMACGTPVLTSNTTSLSEVAGDSGYTVNPLDTQAIANGLEDLLTNDVIVNQLVDLGLARAKLFSWERCAKETIEVYKQVLREQ